MDTSTTHNQPQIETFESKLITIQGTSSLPNEHVYRFRKSFHPQNTANQFNLNKTLNSSVNSLNHFCHLCNKNTSTQILKFCACQDRQYHLLCLITRITLEYKQGNGIMQCPYCSLYYPTVIETNFSYNNLTRQQKFSYFLAFLLLQFLIVVEVALMIAIQLDLPFFILLANLILIELLLLLMLIRRAILVARVVRFSLEEYKICDQIIQSAYAKNSFKIISALKNDKAKQLFNE
ncbi:unnamed protein product (macronuclear) [Paramecium tetraurelia]|uniref:RING-CH-type domain-containing protein n=1 Tax=Paramecium tetraurelia TaxID=5888 RepID=A0DJS8_PARTE|nr:uncharacterized protein GSPATT00017639001 [Paramecium tetraurelia]CAK83295.1 unnamed protein product [Paramecium tetraurelia]|eukprot:XP_001450692.1 hypothetical protein (macronuclear) [Paramecium tetraurelia strain d4-2]